MSTTMGETFYPLHTGRSHEHGQDLTPYSAVSSFNFPQNCDSSLITPVSLTQSISLNTPSIPAPDMDIKLSPSNSISPTYDLFGMDDEFVNTKYNPPMKYKNPPGTLHISTTDASFPPSPLVPSTPYWGAYGVSATPISSRSDSSPSINPSPLLSTLNSAGSLSNDGQPRQPTSAQSYRSRASVPLLIAPRLPSPPSHSDVTQLGPTYRQNSLQSISSTSTHATFPEPRASMPIRRRRKSPKHSRDGDILLSGDMTFDEQVLMRLTEVDRLPWKEVMVKFRERTGKHMKVPALQMRKKRLIERLRVWTPTDERALTQVFKDSGKLKWDQVAQAMLKYGCVEKWSKEMVQKKWCEMHPSHDNYLDEFDPANDKNHLSSHPHPHSPHLIDSHDDAQDDAEFVVMDDCWSSEDLNTLTPHSMHGSESGGQLSAISASSIDEVLSRSRQASDASSHHHLQLQQQVMYEHQHHQQQQQQQQSPWTNGTA